MTIRRRERLFAAAQAVLALVCSIATYIEPQHADLHLATIRHLLVIYVVVNLFVVASTFLGFSPRFDRSLPFFFHATAVVWACCIALVSGGPANTFSFAFFVLILATSASRWGLRCTLVTTALFVVLRIVGHASAVLWIPSLGPLLGVLGWRGFVIGAVAVLVVGVTLGLLGEENRRSREKERIVARLLESARPEMSARRTTEKLLLAIADLLEAGKVLLYVYEKPTERSFLWETASEDTPGYSPVSLSELADDERASYVIIPPEAAVYVQSSRSGGKIPGRLLVLSPDGKRLVPPASPLTEAFWNRYTFQSLLSVPFKCDPEWQGRLFLLNPQAVVNPRASLLFLSELVAEVCPAVYMLYSVRRLRSRVRSAERSRLAHEIHDGVIQSLIALEMNLEVLAAKSAGETAKHEVRRLQGVVRGEVVSLRELMQRLKPVEVDPDDLMQHLASMLSRFRLETGIATKFLAEVREVRLSPAICHELVRVIQEALVNVRKHSGARQVQVSFGRENGSYMVTVGDDGKGFDFSGRRTLAELEAARKGPTVIRERLRLIGGDLVVESQPGNGSTLRILVPCEVHGEQVAFGTGRAQGTIAKQ